MSNQREFVDPNDLDFRQEKRSVLLELWWAWVNETVDVWYYIIENEAGQRRELIQWHNDDQFVEPIGGGKYRDYESSTPFFWYPSSSCFHDCIVTAQQLHKAGWVFVRKRRKLSFKSIIRDLLLISGGQHASSNHESISQRQSESGSQDQTEQTGMVLDVVSKPSS